MGGEKGEQEEEEETARSCWEGRIWEGRTKSMRRREVKNSAEGNAWEEKRESRRRREVREECGKGEYGKGERRARGGGKC